MKAKHIFNIWISLAVRFIFRHRRKTIATGSFILMGTTILVLLHGITVGINDTMVLNTTSLHYGHAFLEIPSGRSDPEILAENISKKESVETVLLRYRLVTLVYKDMSSVPVVFFAVEPEKESDTTAISKRIVQGNYLSADGKEVLLGFKVAESLNVKCGDSISIIQSSGGFLGNFIVSGIFQTDIDRFDEGISFLSAKALHSDFKKESISELSIFFKPGTDISKATMNLNQYVPTGLSIKTWEQLMPDLVQLIEMNKISTKIIMILVFVLVGFGISNNFILTIVERFREFGILKAMGVTPGELVLLVFFESFFVCVIAAFAGLFTGWLLTNIIAYHGIDLSAFTSHNRYFVVSGIVRPRITFSGLYWPGLISIIISIVSSYLPTRIAAKKITAETLRFT